MSDPSELETYRFFEKEWESYEALYEGFEWEVPETFNKATYLCDRWAEDKGKVALFAETAEGRSSTWTFWQLRNAANRLANYLSSRDVGRGDRVAMTGSQKPETLVAMLAAWKLGAMAVPLSAMFGTAGLEYRLTDADVAAFVADAPSVETYRRVDATVETALTVDAAPAGEERAFWEAIEDSSRSFETVETDAESPATMIYTSGTTGDPKGVVHPHRVLLGHLPGFVASHCNMAVDGSDTFWLLAEWSWIGVYPGALCPLYYGRPVVGYAREGFDAERAFDIIETYGVTYFAAPPTAHRMMMQSDAVDDYDLKSVRVAPLGGEAPGEDIKSWIADEFCDPAMNVVYGQTEVDILICESEALGKTREGSLGIPMPGHEVEVLDPETTEPTVPQGEVGELGVRYEGDPICFTEYWNKPEKTAEKVQNGWLRTEDLGYEDEDGYLFYRSRKDDVIISSGYRIGPEEIEESLASHGAVADAGVIGVPHETRGEIPKAFVKLAEGQAPSAALKDDLQGHVKERLAKYEYPREIEFIDELPQTTTGKLRRADLREREDISD